MRLTWQELFARFVGLEEDEGLVVDLGTGWNVALRPTFPDRADAVIRHQDMLFVEASTYTDPKNGMPRIVEEPRFGFEFQAPGMAYPVWLVGAVVCGEDLKVIEDKDRGRFSWSKAELVWKEHVEVRDGQVWVGGKSVGHIVAVFCSNKNRLVGPKGVDVPSGVAVVAPRPIKDNQVRVLEMEDLMFATFVALQE